MEPGEILSLVTAKVAKLEKHPTGIPIITPQDIAVTLSYLSEASSLLLRVKYCGQYDLVPQLDRAMWLRVINLWTKNQWKHPRHKIGKEFGRDMGRLALVENIDPHTCLRCAGVGWAVTTRKALHRKRKTKVGQVETCTACRGTGRKAPTDRARASVLDMPSSTWSDVWARRYRCVQLIVDQLENEGVGQIRRQLRSA